MQYWLMKTEPTTYGIDDLVREGTTPWEGVRNYQARNFMRDDMKIGDKVCFIIPNATPPGIVGLAEVSKESYPDYLRGTQTANISTPNHLKKIQMDDGKCEIYRKVQGYSQFRRLKNLS